MAAVQLPMGWLRRKGWGRTGAGEKSEPSASTSVYPVQGISRHSVHLNITQIQMLGPEYAFFRYVRNKRWEKGERKKGQAWPQTHFKCCDAWLIY